MPKLRTARSVRAPTGTEIVPRPPHGFQKGHKRIAGREKGTPNVVTRNSREAIVAALNAYGRDGAGKQGMIGFCLRLLDEDIGRNGLALLSLITPRQLHAEVTSRNEQVLLTIADLDQDLARRRLPCTQEIFKLDYKGNELADNDVVVPADEDNHK